MFKLYPVYSVIPSWLPSIICPRTLLRYWDEGSISIRTTLLRYLRNSKHLGASGHGQGILQAHEVALHRLRAMPATDGNIIRKARLCIFSDALEVLRPIKYQSLNTSISCEFIAKLIDMVDKVSHGRYMITVHQPAFARRYVVEAVEGLQLVSGDLLHVGWA